MQDLYANDTNRLLSELEEAKHQLREANETIEAIRTGQIDALVLHNDGIHELYTLATADETYRLFIEQMTEGAITVNRDGLILYCNSQFALMVQRPLSSVIGMPLQFFLAESFSFDSLTDFKREFTLTCNGNAVPVLLSGNVRDEKVNIIVTDLSTQKENERQLEARNRMLAESNTALETSNHDLMQFASVASHDLQEPLRKIYMFTNLLLDQKHPPSQEESNGYLNKILTSAVRMKSLIIDILSYSKLSANDHPYETFSIHELVDHVLEDFELAIADKQARITVGALPKVSGNKGQIRQVIQNILSNALKFAKVGVAPEIKVNGQLIAEKKWDSVADETGKYALITIEDNGIGFDEKYLSKIFSLFERLHPKDKFDGTGIGLAITKKIIDKHNGLIRAQSEPDQGAIFSIILPTEITDR
jgi:signal transduction histidine kinase